jgi:predicted Fe-Mo cluster-binding NifX family protein
MKKSFACPIMALALLLAPSLFAAEKPQAGNIAVASDEKKPGSPVADRMGRSRFYLIYDAHGKFVKAMDNPNFDKGPRAGDGQSAIDSIGFNDKGVMTGGLPTPSREERDQTWKGFSDFFARNSITVVVAGQFGYEIVRAMKAGGVTCVEFKGKAKDAVGKVVQLQKQKEASQ